MYRKAILQITSQLHCLSNHLGSDGSASAAAAAGTIVWVPVPGTFIRCWTTLSSTRLSS